MTLPTLSFWEPIAIAAIVNAIAALGAYVTLQSGQLSAAHAALMGVGAYAAAVLTTRFGWPLVAALAVGVVVSAVVGAAISAATQRMRLFVQSLATLGLGETMTVLAYNIDYLGGASSFTGIRLYTTLPLAATVLVLALYFVWRFDESKLGFAARAVRDNATAAASVAGIPTARVRILTFALGGGIAGLAGGLSAHYTLVVNPSDLSFFQSFSILIFVLFGGSYALLGPVLGAGILTIIPQLLRFETTYRFAMYGAAVVLVILLRPEGLLTRTPTGRGSAAKTLLARAMRRA